MQRLQDWCALKAAVPAISVTSLAPGTWILYPSYVTKFGVTSATKGTAVTVVSGATKTVNLTTPARRPTSGPRLRCGGGDIRSSRVR